MNETELNIGVLGCGQIAQAAHLESCAKAHNARLYAICDVADDLRERMACTHGPDRSFADYDEMLADPELDAVIIATADEFHVPASIRALEAGKHVLCEKPMATSVAEADALAATVRATGKIFQVGHMKRYDSGLQEARRFVTEELGDLVALKAWYCDSTRRYAMTDALQPVIIRSSSARRPSEPPRSDLRRYYLLAHGSHLLDTARFLGGPIDSVRARLSDQRGMHCWFVDVEYASGALGHLDLTIAVRMGWHEGFQIYGQYGSVVGSTPNPWYFTTSKVDIFRERDGITYRPLGEDGHFFRRQIEGFADTVLHGAPMTGADIDDGLASVRGMLAIVRSVESGESVRLDGVSGAL
jgi:predicted dehydrogenase